MNFYRSYFKINISPSYLHVLYHAWGMILHRFRFISKNSFLHLVEKFEAQFLFNFPLLWTEKYTLFQIFWDSWFFWKNERMKIAAEWLLFCLFISFSQNKTEIVIFWMIMIKLHKSLHASFLNTEKQFKHWKRTEMIVSYAFVCFSLMHTKTTCHVGKNNANSCQNKLKNRKRKDVTHLIYR